MRKILIFFIAVPGVIFIIGCYLLIFTVIIPNQIYDDKFVLKLKEGFANDIEDVYINNGKSININLHKTNQDEKEKIILINKIFDYIIINYDELDRIEDINFACLPPRAKYYAPDYKFYRGYRIEERRSNSWKFRKINRS